MHTSGPGGDTRLKLRVTNGSGSGTIDARGCGSSSLSVTISSTGDVSGKGEGFRASCPVFPALIGPFTIKGRAEGNGLQLVLSGDLDIIRVLLSPAVATQPGGAFDGKYSGRTTTSGGTVPVTAIVNNNRGSITLNKAGCSPQSFSITISPAGDVSGQGDLNCPVQVATAVVIGPATITGRAANQKLELLFATNQGAPFTATLDKSGN